VYPSCDPSTAALAAALVLNAATPPAMLTPLTLNVPALTTKAMLSLASSGTVMETAALLMIAWLPGFLIKTSATVWALNTPLLHALRADAQPRMTNQFLFIAVTLSPEPLLHVKARVELQESLVKERQAECGTQRAKSGQARALIQSSSASSIASSCRACAQSLSAFRTTSPEKPRRIRNAMPLW